MSYRAGDRMWMCEQHVPASSDQGRPCSRRAAWLFRAWKPDDIDARKRAPRIIAVCAPHANAMQRRGWEVERAAWPDGTTFEERPYP